MGDRYLETLTLRARRWQATRRLLVIGPALVLVSCAGSAPPPAQGIKGGNGGATSMGGGATGGVAGGAATTGGSPGGAGGAAAVGGAGSGGGGSAGMGATGGGAGAVGGGAGATGAGATGGGAGATGGGGGAARDAATAEVSSAGDGGTDGGTDAACTGLVCEDFETGAIDPNKWDVVKSGGTVAVQQQRAAHGNYALQLHGQSGPTDDWALLVVKNVPAGLKGTTTFGRAYVYVAPEATASIHIQLAFAGHNGAGSANGPAPFSKLRYLEAGLNVGAWQLGFDLLDVNPLVEEVSYSKSHAPTNTWVCLEWELEDNPDRVTLWLDGTQVATFDNTNVGYASPGPIPKPGAPLYNGTSSDIVGGFDSFGFGFHDWHPQKAFDLYYDDLVLDAKRVGCLR